MSPLCTKTYTCTYQRIDYVGDERVNEQAGLSTIHLMYVREHNRIEDNLHLINPHWNGERLYQVICSLFGKKKVLHFCLQSSHYSLLFAHRNLMYLINSDNSCFVLYDNLSVYYSVRNDF